ncbi:MAG: SMI1/KNR4 family protein [Planctomycetes bacterium]|nr:SMI1/KNR4 family protein [Planctomycetota bacterium]
MEFLRSAWTSMPTDFDRGLPDAELSEIDKRFALTFPPDLQACLITALPTGDDFPNWRAAINNDPKHVEHIAYRMDWPISSMIFDVENDNFWHPRFGSRPTTAKERETVVRAAMQSVPKLIPICSHRYLPATPSEAGNPVFSVYQTDIIYYGENLIDYITEEFGRPAQYLMDDANIRCIDFWSDMVDRNGSP